MEFETMGKGEGRATVYGILISRGIYIPLSLHTNLSMELEYLRHFAWTHWAFLILTYF